MCENTVGKLYLDLFRCPGFCAVCVERDGQMITPKEFVLVSLNFRSHSDYRRAIKIDGLSFRYVIILVYFYFHTKFLTT